MPLLGIKNDLARCLSVSRLFSTPDVPVPMDVRTVHAPSKYNAVVDDDSRRGAVAAATRWGARGIHDSSKTSGHSEWTGHGGPQQSCKGETEIDVAEMSRYWAANPRIFMAAEPNHPPTPCFSRPKNGSRGRRSLAASALAYPSPSYLDEQSITRWSWMNGLWRAEGVKASQSGCSWVLLRCGFTSICRTPQG